jgi:hypothetical protein
VLSNAFDYSPDVDRVDSSALGAWTITVRTPEKGLVDITTVRGITTVVTQLIWTDPFGPSAATLRLPAITMLDAPGEGDLFWWRPGRDVNITWRSKMVKSTWARTEIRWEGIIAGETSSQTDGDGTVELTLEGALHAADNTLAVPEYLLRPYTFEYAIDHALERARIRGASFAPMRVEWPSWWTTRYTQTTNDWWMQPIGVVPSTENPPLWSGMVTRDTGDFNKTLSEYIQGLLSSMHTERGQFALDLDVGRVPVLRHRDRVRVRESCIIDLVTPGVSVDLTCDYKAKVNVVYGRGKGLDGVPFSNLQFDAGGLAYYEPFAHHQSVHPRASHNRVKYGDAIRREVQMQFHDGMQASEARRAAEMYRQRYSSAGHTGRMTLTTDPYTVQGDTMLTVPRHTLKAGDTIRLLHFQGKQGGVLLNITEANHDIDKGTTTLTVDTVFRDHLSTEEVRLRGRDAMTDAQTLTTGNYNPHMPDQMLPWGERSGYIPVGAYELFVDASADDDQFGPDSFPWEAMTQARPPSDPKWASAYVRIPPADKDVLANNWNSPSNDVNPCVIQMAQAGTVGLVQVMAVDASGKRMAVPFHISFYMNPATCGTSMPKMDKSGFTHPLFGIGIGHYPFFPGAWERINADGSLPENEQFVLPSEGTGIVKGYGTHPIPAGYYPSSPQAVPMPKPTGLLHAEEAFGFDISSFQKDFDPRKHENNSFTLPGKASGIFGVMLYSDAMWDEGSGALVTRNKDVYFIGRLFRQPPGSG